MQKTILFNGSHYLIRRTDTGKGGELRSLDLMGVLSSYNDKYEALHCTDFHLLASHAYAEGITLVIKGKYEPVSVGDRGCW